MTEQKIEKMWYHHQNKLLADKRRDEELKTTLKDWSDAKARMGTEAQRKIEHQATGTRFVESRAYIRSNWKTKKFDPSRNPLLDSSSSEEEEAHEVGKTGAKSTQKKADGPQIVYDGSRDAANVMSPETKD